MLAELIERFKKAKLGDYPPVTAYNRDLDKGLWVLWVYLEKFGEETYLTAKEIAAILTARGVSTKEIEITNAFNRAKKKIDRQEIGGKTAYKIMHEGKEYLEKLKGEKNIEVYFIDGDKHYTDRKILTDLVKTKSEIRIVDPYYGIETLDILGQIDNKKRIRFLNEKLSGNAGMFSRELTNFRNQFTNIELKRHVMPFDLHDRYIITDEALILVGHGIKNLGGKESFVLVLKGDMGKEIKKDLVAKFDQRWINAQNIQ